MSEQSRPAGWFEHQRHKPPTPLAQGRPLIVACCPMRSNVNLSRIVRTASCCGIEHMIVCGRPRIDPEIARDGATRLKLEMHRSLGPALARLKQDDYVLVGLEQASDSVSLYEYQFPRRAVLVVGNERTGIPDDVLRMLTAVVEIPVYGLPFSYNVASATDMALYEYCRQYPNG